VNATSGATARDYFSLFQLEPNFSLDETALEQAYHALLTQFHP
jgi:DnaJ-domain-containing protein 1